MSDTPNYRGYRFPSEIIAQAVWLYHRFKLSFRDVEDLLAERGVTVSYETIRQWWRTFGPQYARSIKRRLGPRGDRWFLDEIVVSIQGKRRYLWRAIDQDGDLIDILVQKRKNTQAAKRFFRKLLRSQTQVPIEITTDKLPSYAAAKRQLMPSVPHSQDRLRQQPGGSVTRTYPRARKADARISLGRPCTAISERTRPVQQSVSARRHLLGAPNYRVLRLRAFQTWTQVTCAR